MLFDHAVTQLSTLVSGSKGLFFSFGERDRDFGFLLLYEELRTRVMNDNLKIFLWDR